MSRNASQEVPASLIAFFVLGEGECPTVYDRQKVGKAGVMRVVRLRAPGGPEQLAVEEGERPRPGPGQALVRVHAAAITRDELKWPVDRLPAIPSYELSGVVEQVGPGVAVAAGGSINAYVGSPKLGPYAVSKGGLMTMTRNAACALNTYRIRVNQLNPGWVLTEGEEQVQRKNRNGGEWLDDAIATRPFGRLIQPREIAYAAAYFASDESALITGAVVDMEQTPVGAYEDF